MGKKNVEAIITVCREYSRLDRNNSAGNGRIHLFGIILVHQREYVKQRELLPHARGKETRVELRETNSEGQRGTVKSWRHKMFDAAIGALAGILSLTKCSLSHVLDERRKKKRFGRDKS